MGGACLAVNRQTSGTPGTRACPRTIRLPGERADETGLGAQLFFGERIVQSAEFVWYPVVVRAVGRPVVERRLQHESLVAVEL